MNPFAIPKMQNSGPGMFPYMYADYGVPGYPIANPVHPVPVPVQNVPNFNTFTFADMKPDKFNAASGAIFNGNTCWQNRGKPIVLS